MFCKKSPCKNCPYRKDAPQRHWHKDEFEKLMKEENTLLGTVYGCHKKDGNVCIGWLMNQDKNNLPSMKLRLSLSKHEVDRTYMDALKCKSELFGSVEEMVSYNYPELLHKTN